MRQTKRMLFDLLDTHEDGNPILFHCQESGKLPKSL